MRVESSAESDGNMTLGGGRDKGGEQSQAASGMSSLAKFGTLATMAGMELMRKLGRRLWQAHLGFQAHEGVLAAAGIAYYLALSFFPLLMVLMAGLSTLLAWTQTGQEAKREVLATISQQASPDLALQVERMFDTVKDRAPSNGPIGFVGLVASAILIFAQLDTSFDRIWRQPVNPHTSWRTWIRQLVYQRLKALGMLAAVGGFIVLVMTASMIWSAVEKSLEPRVELAPWFRWGTSLWINLLLNWIGFSVIYRVVPKVSIGTWDAIRGGLLAALLWEVGRQGLSMYLLHLNYPSAYGIIGSFIAVMLWAYYASLVILFGAEFVRVVGEERAG